VQLENDLQQAIERQEFQIHWQPIISLENNQISGFEALLRWQHSQQGVVSPAEFMPIAEETGLIIPIGWWVLREACRQMRIWQQEITTMPLTISVNLSSKQFLQPDLSKQIEQILQETKLAPYSLRLEIPQNIVIENPEITFATLLQLKTLGVQLQIDNFGISYSFLTSFQGSPNLLYYEKFDRLKIDRSLISQIDTDDESLEVVKTIVAIAHELNINMIATGVETARQVAQLKTLNVNMGRDIFSLSPRY
jgi:EAL domain-containing protein (putative c-di-GMP-specific phosphodiesterase class I)